MAVVLRVQTYIQSLSGLPKDRFENVWYFSSEISTNNLYTAWTAFQKVNDFYTTANESDPTVGSFLGDGLEHAMVLTAYDMSDAEPRPELAVAAFEYGTSTGMIPEEVALCMSYYAARNVVSQRGRLYLGPFNETALTDSDGQSRPAGTLLSGIQNGGTRLLLPGAPVASTEFGSNTIPSEDLVNDDGCRWAFRSVKLNTFDYLTNGWVDDEWDGQRRRRVEATTRLSFS